MKVKKVIISICIVSALLIPATVFAATSNTPVAKSMRGFLGINISTLNDQQKADVKTYSTKMGDVQKEFINKMVENGAITKAQGDEEISKIDEAVKNGEAIPMFGGQRRGNEGIGRDGMGMFCIDTSKLTDQQKADFNAIYVKMATAQKEYLKKQVSSGLLTQVQADSILAKIDESIKNNQCPNGFRFGMGRRGPMEAEENTLTEQQKADLDAFTKNMTQLQKELVNKAVANGVITKDQGQQAIDRIDNPNSFEKGMKGGMGKGGKRGPGKGFDLGKGLESGNSTTQQ